MDRGIVAAALRIGSVTVSMPAPARHPDLQVAASAVGLDGMAAEEGFLDHRGLFLDRQTALVVAARFGQTSGPTHSNELFSEDVW